MTSQFRVPDLVAPWPQITRSLDAKQEVRVASATAVEEGRLIDDVITAHNRFPGEPGGLRQTIHVVVNGAVRQDFPNALPRRPELTEESDFVLPASLYYAVQLRVRPRRAPYKATKRSLLKVGEVLAGDETNEIRRGINGLPIDPLHNWY